MANPAFQPEDILELWFPDNGFWTSQQAYSAWITKRMLGGMDAIICQEYGDLTRAAAQGKLDHWSETPKGRLALIVALDQFPRSLWRDTPGAYAQDLQACRLALEGVENGHFSALAPWEKQFYCIALGHCEGPDHLARMDLLDTLFGIIIAELPSQLDYLRDVLPKAPAKMRSVIERFGRHPHRNAHYGRVSTPQEEAYIAIGDFPHVPATRPAA